MSKHVSALISAGVVWFGMVLWAATQAAGPAQAANPQGASPVGTAPADYGAVFKQYCITCHNARLKTAGLLLDNANITNPPVDAEIWEKVVRKLRAGTMPPQGAPRPDRATYDHVLSWLETALDQAAAANPDPGRPLLHRLNRVEYANAIRDVLALDIDVASLLPPDDAGYGGFDNIADVLGVSPMLQERYLGAAQKISAAALGSSELGTQVDTKYPISAEITQTKHIEGLPLGTRGGVLIRHTFPVNGEYVIAPTLWKTNNWVIRGIMHQQQIEITLDGKRIHLVSIGGPTLDYSTNSDVDSGDTSPEDVNNRVFDTLKVRIPVTAGPHSVGVAFVYQSLAQEPQLLDPLESRVDAVDGNGVPQVDAVMISGPFNSAGAGDTPSRRRILVCRPVRPAEEEACAQKILATLGRRAYRGFMTNADLKALLKFYQRARSEGGDFETGIQVGIRRMLADPTFVFRAEQDPADALPGAVHRLSDLELASRLSFFLWSSVPDDELLDWASKRKLSDPVVFDRQVRRMLADPKSKALVSNFAGQWLYIRNLKATNPDRMEFPNFDDNLRQSLRREMEMFFESIVREDRNVLDLMTADYTFVDERLARHYGIPNVYGSQFRRVTVTSEERKGLLGKGSILAVTSRADRTSPVLRGKWILENILGSPPPPPPPVVPPFPENSGEEPRTVRERLEQHRANPACASCHRLMDPVGLALENFDAVGAWRVREGTNPVEPAGQIFDGTKVDGPVTLRKALLSRPENFVDTLTEKLLTYALGRALVYSDMPAIRGIVHDASRNDYRFSSIVLGIVKSVPFQMRSKPPAAGATAVTQTADAK
jgi:mono/diheme cytochrome c family protein